MVVGRSGSRRGKGAVEGAVGLGTMRERVRKAQCALLNKASSDLSDAFVLCDLRTKRLSKEGAKVGHSLVMYVSSRFLPDLLP